MSKRLAVNDRIFILDEHAKGLADALLAKELDVAFLRTAADSLLKLLFPDNQRHPPGSTLPESLDSAQTRIATQYRQEMGSLDAKFGAGSQESLAFRDALLSFESAAGLDARETPAPVLGKGSVRATTAESPAWDRSCSSS